MNTPTRPWQRECNGRRLLLLAFALLFWPGQSSAQTSLPVIDEVDFAGLQRQCVALLHAAEKTPGLLPEATAKELRRLTREDAKSSAGAEQVQKLLDPLCLVGVSINPESRVKAARGPAAAELRKGEDRYVLVRVHNEAGVTNSLSLSGPQLRTSTHKTGWLEASVLASAPLPKTLDGSKLQYVVVRLRAHEVGKRESTLKFDVGQGTQDLGFRAEVPILFLIRER